MYFKTRRRRLNFTLRILLLYLLVALGVEVFSLFDPSRLHVLLVFNVLTIVEFFCISSLFFFQESAPKPSKFYLVLAAAFICFFVSGWIIERRFQSNNHTATIGEALALTFLSLRYFFYNNDHRENNYFHWLNIGIVIYFAGVLSLFLISKLFLHPAHGDDNTWLLHDILNIIYNVFLAIGVSKWCNSKLFNSSASEESDIKK